jgi:NAD(P)-dependent dehydrogenase (short-subunit alcohol dehydrogenase family)
MVVGAFGCALSLMALVHADTLSVSLTNSTGRAGASTRTVALLALSFLNASIQPLQGASRAFLFDNTCPSRQSVAAAWASRATSFVNILFYFVGNVDLPRFLPFLGNTQAKVLALLAVAGSAAREVAGCKLASAAAPAQPAAIIEHPGAVKAPINTLGLSNGARSGLTGFIAGLARSPIAAQGVTINGLLPGAFDTDRLRTTMVAAAKSSGKDLAAVDESRKAGIPARRYGTSEEFGEVCAFICSVHAGYMTGQNILLDGGAYPGVL